MDIGRSEAEPFWTAFLRKPARRRLRGVKRVISDAHEGIKAAVSKLLAALPRPLHAQCPTAAKADGASSPPSSPRHLLGPCRRGQRAIDKAEPVVLAHMSFPAVHRAELHSTNPLERVNSEIKPRTDVVAIFPNEDAIVVAFPLARRQYRSSALDFESPPTFGAPIVEVGPGSRLRRTRAEPTPTGPQQAQWPRPGFAFTL
jgi:hypothetical protein